MCAVCFTAAQMVPAAAAAGRAMIVRRGMRKLNDEAAALADETLEVAAPEEAIEAEPVPASEERALSSV